MYNIQRLPNFQQNYSQQNKEWLMGSVTETTKRIGHTELNYGRSFDITFCICVNLDANLHGPIVEVVEAAALQGANVNGRWP